MKTVYAFAALVAAVFLAFPIQEMIPPVDAFHGAHVLIVPALFCYAAISLPTPAMLVFAAYTGFLTDLANLNIVSGQVEIGLGWSIVFYVIFGLIVHGFQPAFLRGHWWIPVPLTILCVCLFLFLQFSMITFRRGGLEFNEVAAWRIFGGGLLAGLVSPLVLAAAYSSQRFLMPDRRRRMSLAAP